MAAVAAGAAMVVLVGAAGGARIVQLHEDVHQKEKIVYVLSLRDAKQRQLAKSQITATRDLWVYYMDRNARDDHPL
jgi:hypothetical protein